ncbi:MAG TPA: penicillin acylase family protein, partial [Candidatus Polarisedimenticolia bacterium]|nr:penicillin acylase family protein [Candidatus Polarisedimenticolia bacterium]
MLLLLLFASLYGPGPVPRLGPLLDPVRGIWSVASRAELPRKAQAAIPGLGEPVVVRYDDHAVPHIFAHSELDAVRALGYVVARDRLFQLELQARAGAGRLSELVG